MGTTTWHGVQPFVRTKTGRLGPSQMQTCSSAKAARSLAERLVEGGAVAGAIAFSRSGDAAMGEYRDPRVLGNFGQVPADDPDLEF